MKSQRGFIALWAVLTLAFLAGVVTLVLARWDRHVTALRREGGLARAERLAHALIQRRMFEDATRIPRMWIPPLAGKDEVEGITLTWTRIPLDGRWRVGARPWRPDWIQAWRALGGDADRLETWRAWLETRWATRDPRLSSPGDLIQDRDYAARIFRETGLEARWGAAQRLWTLDEGGSLDRLNLLGVDAEVALALTGVSRARIEAFQAQAREGIHDAASAQAFWSFDEGQALQPWLATRPSDTSLWILEVRLPSLPEPVVTRWRVSTDESTPGNPWFHARPWPMELW